MSGINWKYLEYSNLNNYRRSGQKCVFISHQKKDSDACGQIAEYLKSTGINVYFDEYDSDLRIQKQKGNPKGVTDAIKKAINVSTHMLCVVSPNTLGSTWVPFEVGYGYDKTDLGVLTLKGIATNSLPEYIQSAKYIVRDIYDINLLAEKILGVKKEVLQERRIIKNFSESIHPLSRVMDSIITNENV